MPPRKPHHPRRDLAWEPLSDRPRRIAPDDGVRCDVLGDDRSRRDHRAVAYGASRQHDGAVSDPDIVADDDTMRGPPFEEIRVVGLVRKIAAGAVSEMRLRGAMHR